jgi:formylglycine-generating enzyme required for sulfatase activity
MKTTSVRTGVHGQGALPSELSFDVNGVQFRLAYVEGGTFYRGITPRMAQEMMDRGVDWRQVDGLEVTQRSFYIGVTPVTQDQWMAVMRRTNVTQRCWADSMGSLQNPSQFKGEGDLPVEHVSWELCMEFLSNLNEITHRSFRLPSDLEWEFAARGGNMSRGFEHAGSDIFEDVGWYDERTRRVGLKAPNELGLFDMSGNVGEWCQDAYRVDSYDRGYGPETVRLDRFSRYCGSWDCYTGSSWSARRAHDACNDTNLHHVVRGYYDPRHGNILLREARYPHASWRVGFRLAL